MASMTAASLRAALVKHGATASRLPTTAEAAPPLEGTAFVLSYIEHRLPMSEAEAELMRRLSASERRVQALQARGRRPVAPVLARASRRSTLSRGEGTGPSPGVWEL
jgi:hypothetical protein